VDASALDERRRIFTDISAENRALLIKTHIERWLAANRQRLNNEQITVVEDIIIPFITTRKSMNKSKSIIFIINFYINSLFAICF
jgi:hypothetical protein